MTGEEFAARLLAELEKRKTRRLKYPLTWESLQESIENALNPKDEPPEYFVQPTIPAPPPEFPKLLVHYTATGETGEITAEEFIVINSEQEWAPYHGWYPHPLSELERFKQTVPERLLRQGAL